MRHQGEILTRKQEAALLALLTEPTHEAAALKAEVSRGTLQRWLLQPAFQAAYRAHRRSLVETALSELQRGTGQAAARMIALIDCPDPAVSLRAAVAVLREASRAVELLDLAGRVEELERAAKRKTVTPPQ